LGLSGQLLIYMLFFCSELQIFPFRKSMKHISTNFGQRSLSVYSPVIFWIFIGAYYLGLMAFSVDLTYFFIPIWNAIVEGF